MINLEVDADRRQHMAAELDRAGVPAQVFPGFDYRKEGKEALEANCRPFGPWGVFHPQNMACTLSHAAAWERFLETELPYALILEDDVFVSPELGAWLSDMSWWPEDADIVKIERWRSKNDRLFVLVDSAPAQHLNRDIARLLTRHVGAAGYLLSRKAARLLLEEKPFDITVDNLLFNMNASRVAGALKIYQIYPALVEQGNEPEGRVHRPFVRQRPEGLTLVRQKLLRGYHEVAYPLSTVLQFMTGRAKRARVTFEATVMGAAMAAGLLGMSAIASEAQGVPGTQPFENGLAFCAQGHPTYRSNIAQARQNGWSVTDNGAGSFDIASPAWPGAIVSIQTIVDQPAGSCSVAQFGLTGPDAQAVFDAFLARPPVPEWPTPFATRDGVAYSAEGLSYRLTSEFAFLENIVPLAMLVAQVTGDEGSGIAFDNETGFFSDSVAAASAEMFLFQLFCLSRFPRFSAAEEFMDDLSYDRTEAQGIVSRRAPDGAYEVTFRDPAPGVPGQCALRARDADLGALAEFRNILNVEDGTTGEQILDDGAVMWTNTGAPLRYEDSIISDFKMWTFADQGRPGAGVSILTERVQ
ncbi:MAG: glycosyltransferase family 25 protein [Pseudomonadota bacterium]